ncbi:hypothetical protein M426DRAFT_322536 [Hypoxylon sp. CI-4A]|nr:hypothetical protein M426DRAFT_322536 [Hypoxylon sp. CI-4A]
MTTTTPRIAIIGAGPVGLTLAAILHHNGIKSTIFEREDNATIRSQGGTLDIHTESGQRALAAAGLLPAFKKIARAEGEATRLVRKDGTVVLDENEDRKVQEEEEEGQRKEAEAEAQEIRGRPEIDRSDLKDLLIAALPRETIRWGKGISSVKPVPGTQQWTLEFLNGSDGEEESGPYDLVLGADGAWSRVRPLLTDVRPFYSGVTALDLWISPANLAKRPDVKAFIGKGSCMLLHTDRFLSLQMHGDGSARCYASVRTSRELGAEVPRTKVLLGMDDDDADVDWKDERIRERFWEHNFAGWAAEARDAVAAMTERPVLRHLYMLPVGHTWEPRPGVSLLGDAAHVMTPFAGVGVNVGMVDALELAEGILGYVKNGGDLATVLKTYEEGMFKRSSQDAAVTANMMELEFQENGVDAVLQVMTGGPPPDA